MRMTKTQVQSTKLQRRFSVTFDLARLVVSSYAIWCTETTPAEIASAFRIEDESRIGFWDALIVSSASKNGATRILSEDLNAGQRIAGVVIENPFVGIR